MEFQITNEGSIHREKIRPIELDEVNYLQLGESDRNPHNANVEN
jgi:hypothetical protein